MIVHICTAKQEYVTEVPDYEGGLTFLLDGPIQIDPRKTCEVMRVMRQQKTGGVQQAVELVPMENPRTDDITRLAFDGKMMVRPISVIRVNPLGPFGQAFSRQMGAQIVPATTMPVRDWKDKNKFRKLS